MRIRTQLLIAFLLLAVLPLVGIVGFSYVSSQRAIGRAAAAEAAELSVDMEERMASARERLQSRMRAIPWDTFVADASSQEASESIADVLGDLAPVLEGLTFIPRESADVDSPAPPAPGPAPDSPAPPAPGPIRSGEPVRVLRWSMEQPEANPEPRPFVFEQPGEPGMREHRMLELEREARAELEAMLPPPALEALPPAERDQAFRAWREAAEVDLEAVHRELEAELERYRRTVEEERTRLVFGERALEIRREGELIGSLKPQINPDRLLARVFRGAERLQRRGEIPFAIDQQGRLYTGRPEDRETLDALRIGERKAGESWRAEDWVFAMSADAPTGLRLGVARPIGEALRELRATALRNLIFGLALIALAVLGMLPVSNRISRGVRRVAEGAERIARGDLETRLPVHGEGELAHLARAFNSMARDVRDHQELLVAEERRRRDREVERHVMQAELDRQRRELDEAREFQLSLLPRALPEHDEWQAAVFVETATEVGGDYYDFRLTDDGRLTAVIGDATGHGARAGTMVTVIKSLFSAHSSVATSPASFLRDAGRTVRRMELRRMAMALAVLRLESDHVVLSNAGMPPLLLHRRAGGGEVVDEVVLPGMPLGGIGMDYKQQRLEVSEGDTLLLYSDGLPEQPGPDGQPVGYEWVRDRFARAVHGSPQEIIAALAATALELTGGAAPQDDVTFLVLRRR